MTDLALDAEYKEIQRMLSCPEIENKLMMACYKSNNRYAYKYDKTGKSDIKESKYYNFAPTTDLWCLYCDAKNCTLKCSKCKSVYFCDKECQKQSWSIHKKHCGKDLFSVCILCGTSDDLNFKCSKCPVKFCSKECYDKIHNEHADIDCHVFSKQFGIGDNNNYETIHTN